MVSSRFRIDNFMVDFQIVELKEKPENQCEMEYKFYLVYVKHTAIEDESTASTTAAAAAKTETDIPKIYLRVQSLIEFDTFTATHGPGTIVDGMSF